MMGAEQITVKREGHSSTQSQQKFDASRRKFFGTLLKGAAVVGLGGLAFTSSGCGSKVYPNESIITNGIINVSLERNRFGEKEGKAIGIAYLQVAYGQGEKISTVSVEEGQAIHLLIKGDSVFVNSKDKNLGGFTNLKTNEKPSSLSGGTVYTIHCYEAMVFTDSYARFGVKTESM